MKRYDMRVSDIHTGVDAVKMPEGGWVKWEDHLAEVEATKARFAAAMDEMADIDSMIHGGE